jgi:phospholipid/cholesterol/gamma-HCH transport system substrate-binding protein
VRLKEEIKAGIVVLAAIVLFSLVVIIIGGSEIFERLSPYRIRFADATGIEPRAPVRLNGVYVGRVLRVDIAPDESTKVDVTIGVKPGTPIFDTAIAKVTYMSLIGDYYLAIDQRRTGRGLPPGSRIPSQPMTDFSQLINNTTELAKSMDSLLAEIRPVFTQENVRNVSETLLAMKPLILDVRALTTDLRTSVNHMDAVVTENRQPLAEAVVALKRDLEKIESGLAGLDRLTGKLNRWEQVGSHYGDEILLNLTSASENLQALSRELREEPWRILYRPEQGPKGKE